MPGSGKSTLGKQLALALKLPFVDLDQEIVRKEKKSIAQIFTDEGEDHFRALEKEHLHRWTTSAEAFVMATGGGAPCFFSNLKDMNDAGHTIFLDVPVDEIVRRLEKTPLESRPLMAQVNDTSIRQKVEALRQARLAVYQQAQIHIQSSNPLVSEILEVLRP